MKRCGYLAWYLWLELKQGDVLNPYCPDGPWCGCDLHLGDDDYEDA